MFSFLGTTLSRYLARMYTINLLGLLTILFAIIYLFDTVELLRRSADHDNVSLSIILKMSLLKLPEVMNVVAPFSVLFSALFTFWQLTKRQELVVMRSSGISVWQFLLPVFCVAFLTGIVMTTLMNPIGAVFYGQYNQMEQKFLKKSGSSVVAVFEQGLWLKQESGSDYTILHAEKIDPNWRLQNVTIFAFDKSNLFLKRIDAPTALLKAGEWVINEPVINMPNEKSKRFDITRIPTSLTPDEIEESFSSPRAMGFWALPGFIDTLDETGFDSTRLRIHLQSLLAQPFLYMAMIILAACVALRQQRQGQTFTYVLIGVVTGFAVYIMSNFLQALGGAHQLPVFLAAWSPALIASLFGGALLLTLEDG